MKKLLFTFGLLVIIFGSLHPLNLIKQSFALDYTQAVNINYSIDANYKVSIAYNVSLKNLTDDKYVNKFKLTLPFKIENADAKYKTDPLVTTIDRQENSVVINVVLKQIVGKDKINDFVINISGAEVVKKQGNLNNIFIPGIKPTEGGTYGISLEYSKKISAVNYVSSNPINVEDRGDRINNVFDPQVLQTSGLLVTFGEKQNYIFEFNYKIDENTKEYADKNGQIKLALPYDSPYQDVFYTEISPAPNEAYKDTDGNYIAVFNYNSIKDKVKNIVFKGNAYVKQKSNVLGTKGSLILTDEEKKIYLAKQPYWDTDVKEIKTIVDDTTKGKTTTKDKAKALYDFTVGKLKYSKEELSVKNRQRLGALQALLNPNKAICQEYADLFVTLSRNAGIPARVIVGLAQPPEESINPQTSQTVLHAWTQFYDDESKNWINADPTWQSTSKGEIYFDRIGSNHFEMYINGADSKNPIIPLSFTPADNPANTLKLSNSDKFDLSGGSVVETKLDKEVIDTTLNNTVNLTLRNRMLQVVQVKDINVDGAEFDKSKLQSNLILFPQSSITYPIKVKNTNIIGETKKTVTVNSTLQSTTTSQINTSNQFKLTIKGSPVILAGIIIGILIILIFVIFALVALIKRYKYNESIKKLPNNETNI